LKFAVTQTWPDRARQRQLRLVEIVARDDQSLPRIAQLDVRPQRVEPRNDARCRLIHGQPMHAVRRSLGGFRSLDTAAFRHGHEIQVGDRRDDKTARVGVGGFLSLYRFGRSFRVVDAAQIENRLR
jgi:hypothetical protein